MYFTDLLIDIIKYLIVAGTMILAVDYGVRQIKPQLDALNKPATEISEMKVEPAIKAIGDAMNAIERTLNIIEKQMADINVRLDDFSEKLKEPKSECLPEHVPLPKPRPTTQKPAPKPKHHHEPPLVRKG